MAEGDIGVVIDSGIFNAVRGYYSSVLHVSGDVFAVAYTGPDNDGWITTFPIDSAGNIGAVIDSLEFDIDNGQSSWLIHVSGNIYAIAYWNQTSDDGILKTVDIDNAGNIGAVIDTLTFDAVRGRCPSIILVSAGVVAIAYWGDGDDGWLKTVDIDAVGNIGAVIDSLEFDGTYCSTSHIIHISGDVFAIAYQGNGGRGVVKTVDIDNLGNIGAVIDSFTYVGAGCNEDPKIIHVAGDVYAVASNNYSADNHPGVLYTFTIDNAGNIGGATLDSYRFIPRGIRPYIIHISGDVFAITYRGGTLLTDNFGWLTTIHIANDGNIGAIIDTLEFEDTGLDYPRLIPVAGDIYAIVYLYMVGTGPGYVKTVDIETIAAPTVTTDPATVITQHSAQLNGTLDNDGGEACACGFEWGLTPAYGNITPTQSRITGQTFAQTIIGLDPNKTYHFIAFATNSAGTSYGADRTFTTPVALPTVTTDPATGVSATLATLNGTLVADGGEACDCGFEWGLTPAYGHITPTQSRTTGLTFAQTIIGLDPNKTYHFIAFATNSAGTSYGADRTFTTPVALPTVTTDPATMVSLLAATPNGTLTDDGGEVCACGFEWGTTIAYGNTTPTQDRVTGQTFSQYIFALLGNTTYHFRAFATNSAGTGYGADRTLTTLMPEAGRAYALSRSEL